MRSVEVPYLWGGEPYGTTLIDADDLDEITVRLRGRSLTRQGDYIFVGSVQVHRFVMGCRRGDGLICHHINEDTTDNRKSNIKLLGSKLEHGAEPHPWRDRFSSLNNTYGRDAAVGLFAYERACAGHRDGGGIS